MGLQFLRVARKLGDVEEESDGSVVEKGHFRFAEVEYAANTKLCKELGIKKLPTVFFYSQARKVDGFPCGPKKFPLLLEKISHYQGMSLEQLAFEADMNEGAALGETVLEELKLPPVPSTSTSPEDNKANEKEDGAKKKKPFWPL